jgi:hypothetical protein
MATLVLTTVGTLVGGPVGGAIGAVLGQALDQRLFAPKARHGPRLGDLAVQTSSYGTAFPKIFGTMRTAGTVIWSTDLMERRATNGGGKGRPGTVEYSYSASFAVALSGRSIREVRRIWADGKLLRGAAGDWKAKTGFRLYPGDEDQLPDPLIVAAEGIAQAPAFRGIAYALFEELELADFGNRIPSLSFEVVADAAPVEVGMVAETLASGAVAAGVTPSLSGFAALGDSVRGAIEDLAEIAGLSLADEGDRLVLGLAALPPLPVEKRYEVGRREMVRRAAATLPSEVSVTYYDAARDYQTGLQRARGAGGGEGRAERRAVPAVLEATPAKAMAEQRLDSLWAGRESAVITLTWSQAGLRPGSLVQLEGAAGLWRVERSTIGAMTVRLELARTLAGAAPSPNAASPGRVLDQPDLLHGPTTLRLLELPAAPGLLERTGVAVLAAGPQGGWRRAALSASFDGRASWIDLGPTAAPAVFGTALTVLPTAGSSLFDLEGSVEIELLNDEMELLSRDDDALIAGANLVLIGAELAQFGRAERVSERTYRLSRLLRGRRGTEWAASAHFAGERVALIESPSLRMVDLPEGLAAGAVVDLLASGVGDNQPAQATLTLTGEALRPPAPVHVATDPVSGGIQIRWVRRSRQGWAWSSGADTPVAEEQELYRLTFNGQRSAEASQPWHFYSDGDRAADGPGPVAVEIVQLGTHASSRPATVIIP